MATGRIEPTMLDSVKTKLRLMAGDEHRMEFGDGNTPVIVKSLPNKAAKMALTPQARGSITLTDTDLGQRQLADALKRSGEFSTPEIKAAQEALLTTPAARRPNVVGKYQQDMLERIAMKHFGSEFDTPEEALKYAKQAIDESVSVWGEGNKWVTKAVDEQKGKGKIIFRTPDGVATVMDEAMLQSHLADSAPFLDPEVFDRALAAHKDGMASRLRAGLNAIEQGNDFATSLWKHGALLRPGLAVRAGLDTNLRAMALMSTADTITSAMVGSANVARNAGSAISRIMMGDKDVAEVASQRLGLGLRPVKVDVGGGKKVDFAFSRDQADQTRNMQAMTKGQGSVYKGYFNETNRHLGRYRSERAKWDRYKADSPHWVSSYIEYSEQLLSSPTARWLADKVGKTGEANIDDLYKTPEFQNEFAKVASPQGFTRHEFARQVLHEVETMFPDPSLVEASTTHRLTPKMVESNFPRSERFDVPGPHQSAVKNTFQEQGKALVGKLYENFLDKPDMWLARNPAATAIYKRSLQDEVASLRQHMGDAEEIPQSMLDVADRRARTKAISTVRRTFFDTTRFTGMHHYVSKVSPFFAAWEDAMVSWSRLIHDDPTRLLKLSAAYNAAGTINPYMPSPLLVDQDGKPLHRGESSPKGSYIVVPFKVGGAQMRVRREALNSIAQGDVWWLPGFGPQSQLATTALFANMPQDVVLDLVGTDNWVGKQLLNSMFLNGNVPKADAKTMALSVAPGWVRNIANDVFGDNFAMNVQRNANQRIIDATKQGKSLSEADLRNIYAEAGKTARTAAIVRLISGTGFGMTGTATVEGQFYVDQMHQIEAMPPAELKRLGYNSPQEYFAYLHPQAADLDWNLSRNATGIAATVNAQKNAYRLNGVLAQHNKDIGWMILGRANVDGSQDFSPSAYNMQVSSGDRSKMSADEVQQQGIAALGWKQYQNYVTQLTTEFGKYGVPMTDPRVKAVKAQIVSALEQQNGPWAKEWNDRNNKFAYYYSQAQALSKTRQLGSRSDMVAFREYDQARTEIMDHFGLKSLSNGTGPQSKAAKAVAFQVGQQLAARDFGFEQMWNKFLSGEVDN
jgi:hypothetical protein